MSFTVFLKKVSAYAATNDIEIECEITYPNSEENKDFYTISEGAVCNFSIYGVREKPIIKIKFVPSEQIYKKEYSISDDEGGYINLDDIEDNEGYFLLEEKNEAWFFSVIVYVNGTLLIAHEDEDSFVIDIFDENPPSITDISKIDIEITKDDQKKFVIPLEDKKSRLSQAGVSGIKEVKIYLTTSKYQASQNVYNLIAGSNYPYNDYTEIKNFLEEGACEFYFPIDPATPSLKYLKEYNLEFIPLKNGHYYMEISDAAGNVNIYYLFPFSGYKDPRYDFLMPATSPGATGFDKFNAKPLIDNFINLLDENVDNINQNLLESYLESYDKAINVFEGSENLPEGNNESKKEMFFFIQEEYENLTLLLSYPPIRYEINSKLGSQKKTTYDLSESILKTEVDFKMSPIYVELTNLADVLTAYKYGDLVEFKVNLQTIAFESFAKKKKLNNKADFNSVVFFDYSIYLNSEKVNANISPLNMKIIVDDNINNLTLLPEKNIYRVRDKYAYYDVSISIDEENYLIYYRDKDNQLTRKQIILMATLIPISIIILSAFFGFLVIWKYKKKKI